jgi:hypothetical protein
MKTADEIVKILDSCISIQQDILNTLHELSYPQDSERINNCNILLDEMKVKIRTLKYVLE